MEGRVVLSINEILMRAEEDGKVLLERENEIKRNEALKKELEVREARQKTRQQASDYTAKIFGEKNRIPIELWQNPNSHGYTEVIFNSRFGIYHTFRNGQSALNWTRDMYAPEIKSWQDFSKGYARRVTK